MVQKVYCVHNIYTIKNPGSHDSSKYGDAYISLMVSHRCIYHFRFINLQNYETNLAKLMKQTWQIYETNLANL